jgi:serine/threonine protein kinase/tetratricopeptide (TPR) repeat protein
MALELSKVQEALGGDYTLREEIGHGGMAVVFLADDHRHGRKVAVKILKEEFVGSFHATRFQREIRLEGQLQHPHILPIFDSGARQGLLYFIMPYVEGKTLRERLDREGMLPLDEALRIGREVAAALAHAHGKDVVHRDIKPANILLRDGHAMVADFGVAKAVEESAGATLTKTGVVVGTPAYMSPEQAGGQGRLDGRSDLYSLGCVLYEMLGGEPPFTGPTTQSIMAKHLNEPPPSLATLRPDLPPGVVALVRRLLAKVPADRHRTAEELLRVLEDPKTLEEKAPPPFLHRILPWPWARGTVLVAAVAGLAVLAGKSLGPGSEPSGESLDPHKVAVFPLVDRSGMSLDGGGIDFLIGMALEQTEPLLFRPAFQWLSTEQRANAGSVTMEESRRISGELGAASFITGQIMRRRDSVSVVLTLHRTDDGSEIRQAYSSALLGPDALERAGQHAIVGLLPTIADPGREMDMDPFRELSPGALTNWIQGERQYRLSRFADALSFYTRALEADSLLVLAAVKGAQAANWSHNEGEAPRLIRAASRPDAPLPSRYGRFLEGLNAYIQGQADTAIGHLRSALEEDPDWSEAWMLLAEVHNHLLPVGVSNDSAEAHFLRSAEDPGFTPPLIHLAEKAIRENRLAEAAGFIERLEQAQADADKLRILRAMLACVRDGPETMDFAGLAAPHLGTLYDFSVLLSPGARQPECARAGFEAVLAADAWATNYSWAAAQLLQRLMVAQGEVREAEAFLLTLIENDRGAAGPMLTAVLNAFAGAPMPAVLEATEATAKGIYGQAYESARGVVTPWVLGILHVLKGEPAPVTALRDHLTATARESGDPKATLLANSLSGHLMLMAGDTTGAVALFESLRPVSDRISLAQQLPDALAPSRLRLAEIYLARGEFVRAHDAAAVFDHPEPAVFIPFVPRSLQIRLEAAAGMGNAELVEEYTRRLRRLGRGDLLPPSGQP